MSLLEGRMAIITGAASGIGADGQFVHELCLVTRADDESRATRGLRRIASEISELKSLLEPA